jgi:hypothetical protein
MLQNNYESCYGDIFVFSFTEATTVLCDRCLNNSTCRVITHIESNVSTFYCACLQGWIGERCHIRVRLVLVSVTMTSATLKWEYLTTYVGSTGLENVPKITNVRNLKDDQEPSQIDLTSGDYDKTVTKGTYYRYTQAQLNVNYWSDSQRSECNIVPNLTKSVFTISGLDSRTEYTFCAKTDHTYMCDFDLVSYSNDIVPACVYVTTKADDSSVPRVYIILISCVAIVGLIILLIVGIVSKRNNYFSFLICLNQNKDQQERRAVAIRSPKPPAGGSRPDIYLLKSPTANHTISITAPNCPGKPKYPLIKKRLRGYASFSAQNEQTIPLSTVLEYNEGDFDGEYIHSDAESNAADETDMIVETNIHVEKSDELNVNNSDD